MFILLLLWLVPRYFEFADLLVDSVLVDGPDCGHVGIEQLGQGHLQIFNTVKKIKCKNN